MTKIKNLLLVALLVVLFVEVLIVFPSQLEHDNDKDVRAQVEAQKLEARRGEVSNLASQKMQGVHLVESQQGRRDWELFSQSAEGDQGAAAWKLRDVKVFFYKDEKVQFTVTGKMGSIDSKSKDLSVIGDVVTSSENGYLFKTDAIYYSAKTRLIESPGQVYMLGPSDSSGGGFELKGGQMKVLVESSKMFIQKRVVATKKEKDGKNFAITAEGAEFSGKSREALFRGEVKVSYDKMTLEGPEASFLYKAGTEVLSSIGVKGGVKVSDFEKMATSETVDLDLLTKKYVFRGRPKLIQNNDELIGDEITFLEGGKKVRVEKVKAKVENRDQ